MNEKVKKVLLALLGAVVVAGVIWMAIPLSKGFYAGYKAAADRKALGEKTEPAR